MSEVTSIEKIKADFDSEWVLIENPETTETLEVKGGTVLWHSKDRDELYRKALELKPKHSAILYLGAMPKDTEIILPIRLLPIKPMPYVDEQQFRP
jgi:hypothetical protein